MLTNHSANNSYTSITGSEQPPLFSKPVSRQKYRLTRHSVLAMLTSELSKNTWRIIQQRFCGDVLRKFARADNCSHAVWFESRSKFRIWNVAFMIHYLELIVRQRRRRVTEVYTPQNVGCMYLYSSSFMENGVSLALILFDWVWPVSPH